MENIIKGFLTYSKVAGGEYFTGVLAQRTLGNVNQAGSYYAMSVEELEVVIANADWKEDLSRRIDLGEGKSKQYFIANLAGFFGLASLDDYTDDIVLGVKQTKIGTPKSLVINAETLNVAGVQFTPKSCDESLLVVSVDENGGFILTVFPLSKTSADDVVSEVMDIKTLIADGVETITVKEAKALGFKWAKAVK